MIEQRFRQSPVGLLIERTEEVKCICQRMLIYSALLKSHAAKESYSPTKRFLIELIVVFNIKEKATLFKNVKFAHNLNF